ncbi:MAG: DinB family protein [Verrucomicrobiaceae bacterium]
MGFIFPLLRKIKSRDWFTRLFLAEEEKIMTLVASLTEEQAATPVLIKRIRGIEDSSRHWSTYMTLSHLAIVNLGIAGVIRSIARGKSPDLEVRTQDVKPEPGTGPDILPTFQKASTVLQKTIAGIDDLHTPLTHNHPWFGPLDAHGWHALTAIHMRIHRRQIELIISGL